MPETTELQKGRAWLTSLPACDAAPQQHDTHPQRDESGLMPETELQKGRAWLTSLPACDAAPQQHDTPPQRDESGLVADTEQQKGRAWLASLPACDAAPQQMERVAHRPPASPPRIAQMEHVAHRSSPGRIKRGAWDMSNEDFRKPWVPQEPAYGAYGMQEPNFSSTHGHHHVVDAHGPEPAYGFPAQEMPPAHAAGPQVAEGELTPAAEQRDIQAAQQRSFEQAFHAVQVVQAATRQAARASESREEAISDQQLDQALDNVFGLIEYMDGVDPLPDPELNSMDVMELASQPNQSMAEPRPGGIYINNQQFRKHQSGLCSPPSESACPMRRATARGPHASSTLFVM